MNKIFYKTFIPYLSSLNLFRAISRDFASFAVNFSLFLASHFLLFSYSFLTNPDKTTVSGTVKLEGQTNPSGVKVSLYKLVELDTLVRINQQYPNIGVQISQEIEFYHREQTPVYSAYTNKEGKWEIKDVDKDNYNIVAEKHEYGFKYLLN